MVFGTSCQNQTGESSQSIHGSAASGRVVAKIEWRQRELFPRVGFIVPNLNERAKNVVKFDNDRGTAEQWIKEGKNGGCAE